MINPFKKLFNKKYYIFSVGEWYNHFDDKYIDWGFGRVEIRSDDEEYSIDEYRYIFPPYKQRQFRWFMDIVEMNNINYLQLQIIRTIIKLYFYEHPKRK